MKITKSSKKIAQLKQNREKANMGCEKCPECGKVLPPNRPLMTLRYVKGLFKLKSMRIDCYNCEYCGCEWQSDPYEEE